MTSFATRLARGGVIDADPHGATSPPLYQTATFAQADATSFGEFDYTRTDNPTRRALEELLAELEGGGRALAFASGMAALAATLRLARPGQRVLLGRDLYGGTQRFAERFLDGVECAYVDLGSGELAAELARGDVALVLFETPSNPRLEITDVRAVCRAAHGAGALVAVDATAMTPHLMRPLELGADLAVHSATKGLGGHGDVTAGVVTTADAALAERLAARRNAEGSALTPFESWLLLRGLRTLSVRVDAAQRSARRLAQRLAASVRFRSVRYPGLADHPASAIHRSQARGGGVLVTVECASREEAIALVEDTRLFTTAVSFGGVASSISIPHHMSHASAPEGAAPRPDPTLVRLSVGLEDVDELEADLLSAVNGTISLQVRSPTGCRP